MKKIRRQIIALFLCMAMVITVLPVHIKADAVTAVTSIPFALEGFTCGNDISNVKLTTTEPGIEIVSTTLLGALLKQKEIFNKEYNIH